MAKQGKQKEEKAYLNRVVLCKECDSNDIESIPVCFLFIFFFPSIKIKIKDIFVFGKRFFLILYFIFHLLNFVYLFHEQT